MAALTKHHLIVLFASWIRGEKKTKWISSNTSEILTMTSRWEPMGLIFNFRSISANITDSLVCVACFVAACTVHVTCIFLLFLHNDLGRSFVAHNGFGHLKQEDRLDHSSYPSFLPPWCYYSRSLPSYTQDRASAGCPRNALGSRRLHPRP